MASKKIDPLKLAKTLWPHVLFYKQQRELILSVWNNDETVCPAGNMLGKDFVAGRLIPLFFLAHYPCRIVVTSAKDDHLRVIWGEMGQALQESAVPLLDDYGGPLVCTHREIRRIYRGKISPICYVKGMVASAESIASLQGHHARYTLFVSDESSSVPDDYFRMANGWAKRKLILGNPWNCNNYFYRAVEGDPATNDPGGDIPDPKRPNRFYRKVIRIRGQDSPNVRLGLAQVAAGKEPTNEEIVPGVKSYEEYIKNRQLWDPIQQCVSLDAQFYKGKEVKLFPEDCLKRSVLIGIRNKAKTRRARGLGLDAAEGGDSTVWTVVDEFGIIFQLSQKTSDTFDIPQTTIDLIRQYCLNPENALLDRGGGGKQHADVLRRRGFNVRTVNFNDAPHDPHKDYKTSTVKPPAVARVRNSELRSIYKNRRAEMYGLASDLLRSEEGFGIPPEYGETIRQLKVIPKQYDGEGRLILPPKDMPYPGYTGATIKKILGRSPDEADSFVMAVYGMLRPPILVTAGVAG